MEEKAKKTAKKSQKTTKLKKPPIHKSSQTDSAINVALATLNRMDTEVLQSLYQLWDSFKKYWSPQRIREMTLQEYSSVGSRDTFTYMVERGTSPLGGIGGGSSFKFGVFERSDKSEKTGGKTYGYTENHAWLKRYGSSPEEAFEQVKHLIVTVIELVQKHELDEIDKIPLDFRFKWKIAYLYQNIDMPSVVGIFKPEALVISPEMEQLNVPDRHRKLISVMPEKFSIHEYSQGLWKYWKNENFTPESDEAADDGEANEDEIIDESEFSHINHYIFTQQYTDEPAYEDLLNRKPYADYLAHHVNRLWESNNQDDKKNSFLINLYGAWGAGKTTFAKMLMERLGKGVNTGRPWRTVEFNAWKEQSNSQSWSWWPLMHRIINEITQQEQNDLSRLKLRFRYWGWLAKVKWPHVILLVGMVLLILLLGINVKLTDIDTQLKLLAGILASTYALWTIYSPGHADVFKLINHDPASKIKSFFNDMVKDIGDPIIVLIDDLDRCKPEFAVSLLEHLHIVFNSPRAFFLVSADRDWVSSSFENVYGKMGRDERETGRNVGYSFIEKIFQMAIGLPVIDGTLKQKYFENLIGGKSSVNQEDEKSSSEEIEQALSNASSDKELFAKGSELVKSGYNEEKITSVMLEKAKEKTVESERQHTMYKFLSIVAANPRQMKLIISAYGIYVYLYKDYMSDTNDEDYFDQVAIWTILSVSYPRLAEYLDGHPYMLEEIKKTGYESNEKIPADIRKIASTDAVGKIIAGFKLEGNTISLKQEFLNKVSGYS